MKSIFSGAGYLMNDDRASGGKVDEADMLGCSHCQALLKKTDWKEKGGMCFACSAPLCAGCVERTRTFGCEGPFTKLLERAVNNQYREQQNAKVLGI